MQIRSREFKRNAAIALKDVTLQGALQNARGGFVTKRALAMAQLPELEQLRGEAAALKDHILEHLDYYLERYEAQVRANGGHVHWARDATEACAIVLDICQRAKARTVCKGKSMVSEEIGLNRALEAAGLDVVETDLGEYIIQLADESPSHIIAPAVHKTKEQVSTLFHAHHAKLGRDKRLTDVADLVNEAREVLRAKYFSAEVGITGANFLVAETGAGVIVTNEGNGDLTQTLARVHIVTSSIEKVVPTLDDATLFLRLLARSATGQETETYTTFSSGPRRAGDLDGPEEYHVVLLDNGRARMLAGKFRRMLRCIRCGACMNHCPVYQSVGGHAYGWVYPGPMGSVLTPLFVGLDAAYDLPNACTLNGRCQSVCPVKIPLPELLRELRHEQHRRGIAPPVQRRGLALWAALAKRPRLYHLVERIAARALSWLSRGRGRLARLPLASAWTTSRDMPAPPGRTFLEIWKQRQ